jgi:hypothetical protein
MHKIVIISDWYERKVILPTNFGAEEDGKGQTGVIWFRIVTSTGCCESGNEPSGLIKGGNSLTIRVTVNF